MNLELKKLKVHPKLSEETICFTCEIHIDGMYLGDARNNGKGGSTDIDCPSDRRHMLSHVEQWAKSLPPLPIENNPDGLPMSLELYLNMMAQTHDTWKINDRKEWLKWEEAKKLNHDADGFLYPEFCLWTKSFEGVYYPHPLYYH